MDIEILGCGNSDNTFISTQYVYIILIISDLADLCIINTYPSFTRPMYTPRDVYSSWCILLVNQAVFEINDHIYLQVAES